ncbi:hypothetical protein [Candidatus Finniella inopinata]|uniref:Tail fiber protein n=1 Tax=Candidatus Finniella inopinata TaxID=1696036 RepID=A0A4Q7DL78_9PROT|nr:hypothetical protein [Candidatus Finniella inopinata]RZI45466.1 hypothetical protein EQU50_06895 [Candidatus Finniella inopinata]
MKYKNLKQMGLALGLLTVLNYSAQSAMSIDENGKVTFFGDVECKGNVLCKAATAPTNTTTHSLSSTSNRSGPLSDPIPTIEFDDPVTMTQNVTLSSTIPTQPVQLKINGSIDLNGPNGGDGGILYMSHAEVKMIDGTTLKFSSYTPTASDLSSSSSSSSSSFSSTRQMLASQAAAPARPMTSQVQPAATSSSSSSSSSSLSSLSTQQMLASQAAAPARPITSQTQPAAVSSNSPNLSTPASTTVQFDVSTVMNQNVTIGSATTPVNFSLNGQSLQNLIGFVPIGTILDFWWPSNPAIPGTFNPGAGAIKIPSEFMVCYGQPVTDRASPFYGYTLPNLNGQFVLGASDSDLISDPNSNAEHPWKPFINTSSDGPTTGLISDSNPNLDPKQKEALISSDQGVWQRDENGYTLQVDTSGSGPNPKGQHAHTIPNYIQLLKIIRIK